MDDHISRWLNDPSSVPADFVVTPDWTLEQVVIGRAIIRAKRDGAEWQPMQIAAYLMDDVATLRVSGLFAWAERILDFWRKTGDE